MIKKNLNSVSSTFCYPLFSATGYTSPCSDAPATCDQPCASGYRTGASGCQYCECVATTTTGTLYLYCCWCYLHTHPNLLFLFRLGQITGAVNIHVQVATCSLVFSIQFENKDIDLLFQQRFIYIKLNHVCRNPSQFLTTYNK